MRSCDLVAGMQIGRWTLISRSTKPRQSYVKYWLCRCACGTTRDVGGYALSRGLSKSCGCASTERLASFRRKHGQTRTRAWNAWVAMIRRCHEQNHQDFKYYGGRGITVSEEWRNSFQSFLSSVGPAPTDKHTIERIDNSRGYEHGNCRWATRTEQCRNQRKTHYLTFRGVTRPLPEWSELTGIPSSVIYDRVNKLGWTTELALTKPIRTRGRS